MNTTYQAFIAHLEPTPSDIEGPFYLAGAPMVKDGNLLKRLVTRADNVLLVSGSVLSTDGQPVMDAILDIWQADEHGVYDEKGYTLRGKIAVNDHNMHIPTGHYSFETIMPGDYQIADNPPDFRCAHIHVKVTAEGYKSLTTQLYFPDDKYNGTDHWFDKRRVIQHPNGTFNFVLEKL